MLFLITILQSNSKQYSISYQNEAQRCSAQRTFTYLFIHSCPKKVRRLNFQFEGTGRHKEKPEEMIKEELREVFRKIKLPKVQKITEPVMGVECACASE